MIDLKESRRIKDALKNAPLNYEKIIQDTFLGICVTNTEGILVNFNDAYNAMYGYKREEMLGNSFLMVVQDHEQSQLDNLHSLFIKLKDEIMRNWQVVGKDDIVFRIFADAEFSSRIDGSSHKITFVWPEDVARQEKMKLAYTNYKSERSSENFLSES